MSNDTSVILTLIKRVTYDLPQFIASNEDLESWKSIYSIIDGFRTRLKQRPNEGLVKDMNEFIDRATGALVFTYDLAARSIGRIDLSISSIDSVPLAALGIDDLAQQNGDILTFLHRLLVYMGDMARYRDQFTKSAMPVAKKMYIKSVLLAPLEGSPFNQLSILSASSGEFLLALFFAYRSLVSANPFPNARQNTLVLLDRGLSSTKTDTTVGSFQKALFKIHACLFEGKTIDEQSYERFVGVTKKTFVTISSRDALYSMALNCLLVSRVESVYAGSEVLREALKYVAWFASQLLVNSETNYIGAKTLASLFLGENWDVLRSFGAVPVGFDPSHLVSYSSESRKQLAGFDIFLRGLPTFRALFQNKRPLRDFQELMTTEQDVIVFRGRGPRKSRISMVTATAGARSDPQTPIMPVPTPLFYHGTDNIWSGSSSTDNWPAVFPRDD